MPLPDLPYPQCPPLDAGAYGRWFTDAGFWAPYVRWVARRHGLAVSEVRPVGVPGSHPVFLTGAGGVVKFYAPHWPADGEAEAAVYDLLGASGGGALGVAVPRVLARGALFAQGGRWPWPYLAVTALPGRSVGELRERLSGDDLFALAGALGPVVRGLHGLPLPESAGGTNRLRHPPLDELRQTAVERLRDEGGWPEPLLAGIPAYVDAALAAGAGRAPRLVHADLTQDHVLLAPGDVGWSLSGLIDFADAVAADPAYELVALHVDLLRCDRRLLAAFLQAYGGEGALGPAWRMRATAFVLLFPFSLVQALAASIPDWALLRAPRDLEDALWPGR